MTDTALGDTALAQMKSGTDEAMFAGLLLLTKCSRITVEKLASQATDILLGVVSHDKTKSVVADNTSSSNFLRRLLLTKSQTDNEETGTKPSVVLSQMQAFGLNVTTTLAQTGQTSVQYRLATSLGSTVAGILDALVASPIFQPVEMAEDSTAALDVALESALLGLLTMFGDGLDADLNSDCPPWPPKLMRTLVRVLRCYPQGPASAAGDSKDTHDEEEEVAEGVPSAEGRVKGVEGSTEKALRSRVSSLAFHLARRIVMSPPPTPFDNAAASAGSSSSSSSSSSSTRWLAWAAHIEGVAGLFDHGFETATASKTTPVAGGGDEKDGEGGLSGEGKKGRGPDGQTQVGMALDLVLCWARAIDATGFALPPETRASLEGGSGSPFASSLRRGVVMALHGGASEALRDKAVQACAAVFQVLGGGWAIEEKASSATLRGSTACLFLGVTGTELRLLVDEALAIYEPPADNASPAADAADASLRSNDRLARISRVTPVCLEIVEQSIKFLCEGDDEDDDEDEDAGEDSGGKEWSSLPSASLLAMQQTLIAVARTIIEFLQDARAMAMAGSKAKDESGRRLLLSNPQHNASLRGLALACGRCLSCWLSQDSGGAELLKKELTDSRAFAFLLSLSAYSNQTAPPSLSSLSITPSHEEEVVSASLVAIVPPPPAAAAVAPTTTARRDSAPAPLAPPSESPNWSNDDDSVDSDDECPPASQLPRQHPPPPTQETSTCRGDAGEVGNANATLGDGGGGGSGGDEVDVLFHLLPALTSLCDGSDGGPAELIDVIGAHLPVCAFISSQLGPALLTGVGGGEGATMMPLVWSLDLLVHVLSDAATHLVCEDEVSGDDSAPPFQGRLADHPCFAEAKTSILRACTCSQRSYHPTIGFQRPVAGGGSTLGRLVLDHAVALFLVMERHASPSSDDSLSTQDKKDAHEMISAFVDRTRLSSVRLGAAGDDEDSLVALAISLATSRARRQQRR